MPTWDQVLNEIQKSASQAANSLNRIRHRYLKALFKHTKRNVIAYYSGFLSKPHTLQNELTHEDLNGFMQAVHKLDRELGLDIILHTPGGQVSAALSVVNYIQEMFDSNIRAIVPQIAMSAGTMIACSCNSIVMSKHSQLGPTDPHLKGIPAAGVKSEFLRACDEVKEFPERIPMWQQIIGQYRPTFLSQCENAMALSQSFVAEQLQNVMFEGEDNAKSRAQSIVDALTDYTENKGHDRPIHIKECQDMGLKVVALEDDDKLQDLVLTVHHCYMHSFMNTQSYKIIENHLGHAIIKNDVKQN